MSSILTRRCLIKTSGLAIGASLLPASAHAAGDRGSQRLIHLNLNENAFGPSPSVNDAIRRDFDRLSRYADAATAQAFAEQIAAYERVPVEQVVLGEILGALGLYLGSEGGPGGQFIYSTPGYLALIGAASRVGGVGVPVPLNAHYENDLPALASAVNRQTRAVYLINPHNPTGTVSDNVAFKQFLHEVSLRAPVIVDEAYLEYTNDFEGRSAVSLVRDGANVLVFRTFDKIHGLAGLPIGYTLAPRSLAVALHKQGVGDAESLGRLNLSAASAALADTAHVRQIREITASERTKWFFFSGPSWIGAHGLARKFHLLPCRSPANRTCGGVAYPGYRNRPHLSALHRLGSHYDWPAGREQRSSAAASGGVGHSPEIICSG
jgi:histidinol-phosphate aminotransferase